MPDLTVIAAILQSLFTDQAQQLARATGLVQRNSKLTGPLLLLVLVAGFIQHPHASYNILAQVAEEFGVTLTRQAIQQRLTATAVCFFQQLFQQSLQLLQTNYCLPIPLLIQFNAVHLLDSTQIALPDSLSSAYAGAGGSGPQAGLKWQVLWEVLSGKLQQVVAQAAKQSDHSYHAYSQQLSAGSLILFDLGYVALNSLRELCCRQVYFICHCNPCFTLYSLSGQPFSLHEQLLNCKQSQIEYDLLVGAVAQLPLRLVACHLPAQVCEQRRRRAHVTEHRKGITYSAAYKAMLDWNVYLTNVATERLSLQQVSLVYRLRWQVELLFKLWKSGAELDRVAGKEQGRVLCEMYAKLLGVALFGYLSGPVRLQEAELSAVQAWQVLTRQIAPLALALRSGVGIVAILRRIYELWQRFASRRQRRDRPTTLQQLQQQFVNSLT